jgi:hypothetical protein
MNDSPQTVPNTHLESASHPPGPPRSVSAAPPLLAPAATVVAALGIPVGFLLLILASSLHTPSIATPLGVVGGTGTIVVVLRVLAVIEFVGAAALILAGIGVLLRKQWGRILTLVLAIVLLLTGLGGLSRPDVRTGLSALLHLGFAVFALVVLLRPRYAAEFSGLAVSAVPQRPAQESVPVPVLAVRGRAFAWWVVLLFLATHVGCVLVGLFARPVLLELQRHANEQSPTGPHLFTQQGQSTVGGDKPFKVYYAIPYLSEPNLTVEPVNAWQGGDPGYYIKEQEPNCFVVVPTRPGSSVSIRWTAKGRLADK